MSTGKSVGQTWIEGWQRAGRRLAELKAAELRGDLDARGSAAPGGSVRVLPAAHRAPSNFRAGRTAALLRQAAQVIDLLQVASGLQRFLLGRGWRFCFIGGLALQRWGEPRVTHDIDCTLLTGFGDEVRFVRELLDRYESRIADAETFALQNRVLLLRSRSGIGIDLALGGLPFEALVIERASDFLFLPEVELRTCSAEDLIVLKAFANRRRDWADIEGILVRQEPRLDWRYVYEQLAPLCELKEEPGIIDALRSMQRDAQS